MGPRFLLDEHLDTQIAAGLKLLSSQIEITYIGAKDALPKGTPDPVILDWIGQNDYVLVTNNRKSMPVHITDHFAQGRHFPGIIILTST